MPAPAEFLLVDIGNTTVKLRRATARRLVGATVRLPTAGLTAPALIRALGRWRYRRVVLSSVAPAAADVVVHTLPEPVLSVSARLVLGGVDVSGYPGLRTLGADRLANLAGALSRHTPGPMIVVDLGTAATFNALDGAGRFLGGAIAPGLGMLAGALHEHTAGLPLVRMTEAAAPAVGRNTREAMAAGVWHGFRGLVREILAELHRELGPWKVVATGGNARRLAAALPGTATIDPDLTLHGLRIIGAHNAAPRRSRRAAVLVP